MDLLGFVEGDTVKMYCVKNDGGDYVVKALISDHASITPEGSWFIVEGTILDARQRADQRRRRGPRRAR